MSDKGYWYAAGLDARAKELEADLRGTTARVARLDDSYGGVRFDRYKRAMELAVTALRDGVGDLRSPLPDTERGGER